MSITTTHPDIGYTNNVEIIERALQHQFGFDDQSHVLRAVAAHIWAATNPAVNGQKTWGTAEIISAISRCQLRLQAMSDKIRCNHAYCAVSYPHAQHT